MLDLHSNSSLYPQKQIINGVKVEYIGNVWRSNTFILTPKIISLLSKELPNYDIIHIHDCRSFQGIITYLFSRAKKIPYVFQPHGSYLSSSYSPLLIQISKKTLDSVISDRIFRGSFKVIALTSTEANQYRQVGFPSKDIVVIPNGLCLDNYANFPPRGSFKLKLSIDPNSRIILYLGRINRTKGIELLLKAFFYLKTNFPVGDVRLVMAGPDDGYLSEAKLLACSLGISNSVLFTGFLNQSDKLAALIDADVFLTPAFSGFPITFLEACYAGLPIITTTMGDIMPWIDNKVGFVTKPTISALADSIYSLLSDAQLHANFSQNCKQLLRSTFSIERTVDQLEGVYRSIINV
jgi:glycosyltransferase involved in cell wall biosynthesis